MNLITKALAHSHAGRAVIAVSVDRHKLARRRWRGVAADGTDFGFDLNESLNHGDCIYETDTKSYVIEQTAEDCFLIALKGAQQAAWIGWMVGNLHFKASFSDEGVLVQDDLAVEQMLDREHIHYDRVQRVFQPAKQGGHSHDHDHGHSHSLSDDNGHSH
ncbi:MAG: urease accessory protein UreE [Opitutales bacterium]|jgi:urease accessory protein